MMEKELNHGRLAMIAIIGMIGQEYFTGISVIETAVNLVGGSYGDSVLLAADVPSFLDQLFAIPKFIQEQMSQAGMGVEAPMTPPLK